MCCFSGKVELVADTNIFARASKGNRQFLVYSMRFKAADDLAMILPLPVPKATKDDAVTFINLEKYPTFFDDMYNGFPKPVYKSDPNAKSAREAKFEAPPLKVVEVGSFVASFVPAVKDFARLDERFRLPADLWDKLPQYKNSGFAVFQLKKGEKKVHPMAFEFPRANPRQLFFPTVHIHDGSVPERAFFDHTLYCQASDTIDVSAWEESPQPAEMFMTRLDKAEGIVDDKGHCYKRTMRGRYPNTDVTV